MEVYLSWYQVADLEKAKKFYGETLGLNKIFEMDGWAEFSHAKGAACIGLMQTPSGDSAHSANGHSGATVVLRVDDIEKTRNHLSRQGVKLEGDIREIPGVVKLAAFRDPSGNLVQLAQSLVG